MSLSLTTIGGLERISGCCHCCIVTKILKEKYVVQCRHILMVALQLKYKKVCIDGTALFYNILL